MLAVSDQFLTCTESGCCLLGGETAEMPGMYKQGDYDIAGFCVGAVERDQLIPKKPLNIKEGDKLIALTSSVQIRFSPVHDRCRASTRMDSPW